MAEDDEISSEEAERLRLELIEAFGELGFEIELTREAVAEAEKSDVELPGAQQGTVRKVLSFRLAAREGDE